jgi:hypothetical protein
MSFQNTDYYLRYLKNNFSNWTSGNEKIDEFIQERLNNNIIFEWIPYDRFNKIEETGKINSIKVYSAIWKDGPLHYNDQYEKNTRDSNKNVILKCLQNSQNTTEFLINEVQII